MSSCSGMEDYVNGLKEDQKFDPSRDKASISTHYFKYAKDNISDFLNNSKNCTNIGFSSGDRRSHELFRSNDGTYYEIHYSYGNYSYCSYLTPSMISQYFDEGEELPTFIQPKHVQELINKY
jgi:hypothetical protein